MNRSPVETLWNPARYTLAQIRRAVEIQLALGRGVLRLCEPPALHPPRQGEVAVDELPIE